MSNWKLLTDYLDSLKETYGVPGGEIRVTKEQKEVFHYLFGDRTEKGNEKKNLYWFYSMSKVYTSVSALQLVERGEISLEQKVTDFFPGLLKLDLKGEKGEKLHPEKTTVRNLFTMTGGLNYTIDGEALKRLRKEEPDCMDVDRIVEAIYTDAMFAEPQSRFYYSLCHDILGAIVWKVSGMPLNKYMKKHIFEPLGINQVGFFPDEEQKERFIGQYRYSEGVFHPVDTGNQIVITDRFPSGGAGLFGCLEDYMKLPEALADMGTASNGCQILEPETIEMMRRDQMAEMGFEGQIPLFFQNHGLEDYGYGLGVRTRVKEGTSSPVGEFGWDGAAGGHILIDTENRLTMGYLQHTMEFGPVYGEIHPQLRELLYQAMKE